MGDTLTADLMVTLIATAVFFALVVYFALEKDIREKLLGVSFLLASVGGIILYGFCYSYDHEGILELSVAVLRTLVDVGRMFVGVNNEAEFSKVLNQTGISYAAGISVFWIVHFLAYYSMASAAILALGKGVVREIRKAKLGLKDVVLIYGITDSSLAYGRQTVQNRDCSVVFAGRADLLQESEISKMGALLFSDEGAIKPDMSMLKRLHISGRRRKLELCVISEDEDGNYNYALRFQRLLRQADFKTTLTSLILLGREERHGAALQAGKDHYGYGDVKTFDVSELTARLLLQKHPICDAVSFDENGKAEGDTRILIVGFGRMGQEFLKKAVANGQFEGSHFSADVFDPNYSKIDGFFRMRYAAMLNEYEIHFYDKGGSSREFCEYLKEYAGKLSYIVIAVGNLLKGREIADDIMYTLIREGVSLPVYQCSSGNVVCYQGRDESECFSLHDADILYGGTMDELAMQLNHHYNDPAGSPAEQWLEADYFSHMSCRASADFLSSYLKRLHATKKEEVSEGKLEIMARTEHLRWNAFHFSMEYACMSREEWDERAEEYKKQERSGSAERIRISKNAKDRRHACLVGWDELDELSERENAVTGRTVDYKQMDRDNVKVVMGLL
ncbi:MAG: hypothetical protein IKI75_04780 [Lachnospiraceae bacterium]|nr:hypothetical protein [Lachnospiraceae bacterium]